VTLVGVLGGGQLGRMLALAGLPLGLRFRFLDPSPRPTAAALGEHVQAAYDDPDALARFVDGLDVVTFEFERVPVETVEWLANHVPVRPGARSLRVCGDRVVEKRFARLIGAPTAPFAEVDDLASLERAVREVGTPAILKTRRDGYDGKGQVRVHEPAAAEAAWRSLGSCPCVLEGFVPFTRELAVLAVRDLKGEVRTWPLVETRHADGILVSAVAPAPRVDEALQAQAQRLAERVTRELDHVGVIAIECFEHEGRLLINEIAPRVHNSGHWTIEGAVTSQFENHLRAVLGLPLGPTGVKGYCGLANVLGQAPERARVLALPGAHLHLYDKPAQPRRKVGHVTVTAPAPELVEERLRELAGVLGPECGARVPAAVGTPGASH